MHKEIKINCGGYNYIREESLSEMNNIQTSCVEGLKPWYDMIQETTPLIALALSRTLKIVTFKKLEPTEYAKVRDRGYGSRSYWDNTYRDMIHEYASMISHRVLTDPVDETRRESDSYAYPRRGQLTLYNSELGQLLVMGYDYRQYDIHYLVVKHKDRTVEIHKPQRAIRVVNLFKRFVYNDDDADDMHKDLDNIIDLELKEQEKMQRRGIRQSPMMNIW